MTLLEEPPRSLRLRIDRTGIADNWRMLDALSGSAETGAAVKANAYGVGVEAAVPALLAAGARSFFVAHWSEVGAVRTLAAQASVSVLHGVRNDQEAAYARATGAIPVINSLHQAQVWSASGGGPCHLMVDTGINRLGIAPSEIGDPAIRALTIDTLMSHLASADEDSALNALQLQRFREAAAAIPAKRLSLANSAGIARGADFACDLTRPGLALYGGVPHPSLAGRIRQVAFPEAAILQIRHLAPGDSVGYNATWTAQRPTRAATVSIGYADGFLRQMGPDCALQHEGKALPLLGRVSMDMIVVDASDSTAKEGDFLEIPCELPEVSRRSGLSQYEVLTVLGQRFARN